MLEDGLEDVSGRLLEAQAEVRKAAPASGRLLGLYDARKCSLDLPRQVRGEAGVERCGPEVAVLAVRVVLGAADGCRVGGNRRRDQPQHRGGEDRPRERSRTNE